MTWKQKVYAHYRQLINEKIAMLQQVLADLKESGSNETKSTAGDKHETALAMLQIEQANTRVQLQEFVNQLAVLGKINPEVSAATVVNGSLIETNRGYFFMSVALGKALIEGVTVIALSPQSPLGKKMMGSKAGTVISVNDRVYQLLQIE